MPSPEQRLTLTVIHASLLAAILVFFGITLYMAPDPEAVPVWWRWTWVVVTAGAVFGAGFVRGRLPRNAAPERIQTAAIVIWALAEGSAMFGTVTMLVTGALAPGLGATLVAVVLFVLHRPSTLW